MQFYQILLPLLTLAGTVVSAPASDDVKRQDCPNGVCQNPATQAPYCCP